MHILFTCFPFSWHASGLHFIFLPLLNNATVISFSIIYSDSKTHQVGSQKLDYWTEVYAIFFILIDIFS